MDIEINEALSIILVAYEERTEGDMSWNLIEHEDPAWIIIWKFDPSALDKIEILRKIPLSIKICTLLQSVSDNKCIIGMANGKLNVISLEGAIKESQKINCSNISLFTTRVISISWLVPDKIFIAIGDETSIKIFDFSKNSILNGGSLSKTLKGSILTCMEVDQKKSRVYLGTNKGIVLVYDIEKSKYKQEYLYTITFEPSTLSICSLKLQDR